MDQHAYVGFQEELAKIGRAEVGQLLGRLAERRGLNPSAIPGIKQVSNVAGFDRGRAAEIAGSVKNYIKSPAAQTPAAKAIPRSAPNLPSVGLHA
jgi:hypothetical protein